MVQMISVETASIAEFARSSAGSEASTQPEIVQQSNIRLVLNSSVEDGYRRLLVQKVVAKRLLQSVSLFLHERPRCMAGRLSAALKCATAAHKRICVGFRLQIAGLSNVSPCHHMSGVLKSHIMVFNKNQTKLEETLAAQESFLLRQGRF